MVQAVRGMRDILPLEGQRWRMLEDQLNEVLLSYGYEPIALPLLEFTDLFARGVGEATDIVEKEMYSLADRDGDSLSLRPEGTAGCVRALLEHGLLFNQTQRVFYAGPMFRYEKPQKGRYRQFYQIGAEAFGMPGPDIDAELIKMCADFWTVLGITDHVRLEVNSLGDKQARQRYREALVNYLTPFAADLDEDSARRLQTNPLRILDSKVTKTQQIVADAPTLESFVDDNSRAHFDQLRDMLTKLGVPWQHNPKLVRGLDYYTHTVFEWITDSLGAQGTVCAGGRYDGLVEQLEGRPTPAVGFALGLDRVTLLHEVCHQDVAPKAVEAYVCVATQDDNVDGYVYAQQIAHLLRQGGLRTRVHAGSGNFKKQLKRADAVNASWAVLLGQEELSNQQVTVKYLATGEQNTLSIDEVLQFLTNN